jgi:alginate O-acetyltransferase complex protein AlgI
MAFNSLKFLIFFIGVYLLSLLLKNKGQNRLLLFASYFFYWCWDWRFLSVIIISTIIDYYCGIQIYKVQEKWKKKRLVIISISINLGLLCFFKYSNFFLDSFIALFTATGISIKPIPLNIILPVGISFYTLQKMTYTIDIFRDEMKPTKNFINFALFVSFFPQLLSGPIERAKRIIPQFEKKRVFNKDQLINGIELIFWGLFKKVFMADNLGLIVDRIYSNSQSTGCEYVIATWAFAFQLYGDFSGYSDMARGIAKCLGIEIMENFKAPYLSINPSDFWRRWHISLSSWLRDYLYISLGGNRKGNFKTYRNLVITMLLSGLWHGAAWNYVIWGVYHGILLGFHRTFVNIKSRISKSFYNTEPLLIYFIKALIFFQIICFGWIFFRSRSLDQIHLVLSKMLNISIFSYDSIDTLKQIIFLVLIPLSAMIIEAFREIRPEWFKPKVDDINFKSSRTIYLKSILYGTLTYLLCLYGASTKSFIYSKF